MRTSCIRGRHIWKPPSDETSATAAAGGITSSEHLPKPLTSSVRTKRTATVSQLNAAEQELETLSSFKLSFTGCLICCSWNWVGLSLIWVFHHLAQPLLPNSHQHRHNWGDSGALKIQVNPTQSMSRWEHETPCIVHPACKVLTKCPFRGLLQKTFQNVPPGRYVSGGWYIM